MDDIFSEIQEDIRRDRMKSIWDKYGAAIIGLLVLIVVGTAGWRYYDYAQEKQRQAEGDAYLNALVLLDDDQQEEGVKALQEIEASGFNIYQHLAAFRLANLESQQGNLDKAITMFEALAQKSALSAYLQKLALLRAGYLKIETKAPQDEALRRLSEDQDSPFRFSAREILALSAYRDQNWEEAQKLFTLLGFDVRAPQAMQQRARLSLELIQSIYTPQADVNNEEKPTNDGDAS